MGEKYLKRDELLQRLFPLGTPPEWKRDDWDYSVSARSVYQEVMKCHIIEQEDKPQGTDISNTGLPLWVKNTLLRSGVDTIEEVLLMNHHWLLSLKRIGSKKADDIIAALEEQGYDCRRLKCTDPQSVDGYRFELAPCPICKKPAVLQECKKEFSIICSDDCCSPKCEHHSFYDTVTSWNDWVRWYKQTTTLSIIETLSEKNI